MNLKKMKKPSKVAKKKEIFNNYNVITDEKLFLKILKEIDKKKFISLDLETTSLDYIEAQIVGISIALDSKNGHYIPLSTKINPNTSSCLKNLYWKN